MSSGKEIEFDLLVTAVGVRPNVSLASAAGIAVGKGITVNAKMETSVPDIYAVGDCTETTDVTTGDISVLAILPNASMEGRVAGANMAISMTMASDAAETEQAVFDKGIKMNSIGFYGMHILSAGTYYNEENGGKVYMEKDEKTCKKLFTKDGYLTGFILVDRVDRAGIYTNMIRNRIPLASVDFDMLCKEPSLYPFGSEYRGQKLGGVV